MSQKKQYYYFQAFQLYLLMQNILIIDSKTTKSINNNPSINTFARTTVQRPNIKPFSYSPQYSINVEYPVHYRHQIDRIVKAYYV